MPGAGIARNITFRSLLTRDAPDIFSYHLTNSMRPRSSNTLEIAGNHRPGTDQNCSKGYYSPSTGSHECEACTEGYYAEQPGAATCLACPSPTWSNKASEMCDLCFQVTKGRTDHSNFYWLHKRCVSYSSHYCPFVRLSTFSQSHHPFPSANA